MTQPPRRATWDEYDAYLFDIDGTLLHCTDAVHYFAFLEALERIAGKPLTLDGITVQGNVDQGILRDAFTLAGVPESAWRPRLPEIRAGMCRFVEAHKGHLCTTLLPAVPEVLDHLLEKGAVLGVATGNLAGIGRNKLAHAGLLDRFHFGGYSDAFENRRDVFAAALAEGRSRSPLDAAVCVVGDTPEDVRAALANGVDVIATATGIFSYVELEQAGPTWCVHSLEELLVASVSRPTPQ